MEEQEKGMVGSLSLGLYRNQIYMDKGPNGKNTLNSEKIQANISETSGQGKK